ncbi:hypothetical protein BD560DRAFT_330885 [Blakeslea trispora]|nr:hypothetical protein BD560DRAFT_330885 [Blakeslea trispora]
MDTLSPPAELPIRPRYDWVPEAPLNELMHLDTALWTDNSLPPEERKEIIDSYPPVRGINYQPPDTMPRAAKQMRSHERTQDLRLKQAAYATTAIFRPLDILTRDIFYDNMDRAKILITLNDIRRLTLHCVTLLHNSRIDLAYSAVDHRVQHNTNNNKQYLLDEDVFDEQIQKKSSAANTARRTNNKSRFDRFKSPTTQPFRSGPPSQHGGSSFNNHSSQQGFQHGTSHHRPSAYHSSRSYNSHPANNNKKPAPSTHQ